ncbi:hAT dimerization domain-containing protein/transposase-related [Abeliophyllum distichum]|uniref:HAT dimerization domain-containing protein/transposase-related n=1 Tax=Abeliophyllum distichum TaxID=126358 RepID=A0ABD1QU42_9LAMI
MKIVAPLIRLIRIVDADEKPSLVYVYDGMDMVEKTIKNIFLNKERLYKPYIDIIDARWDKHLQHDIHVAAYFLNPAFIYEEGFCQKIEVMNDDNENIEELHTQDMDDPDVIRRFGGSSDLETPQRFRLVDEIDSDDN